MRRSISPDARLRYERVPLPGLCEQKLLQLLRRLRFASSPSFAKADPSSSDLSPLLIEALPMSETESYDEEPHAQSRRAIAQ